MTAHSPLRCANTGMVRLPSASQKVVLMDTGAYPGYSDFLNQTWTWNGTDWTNTATSLIDANGPLPGRINMAMAYDGTNVMLYGGQPTTSVSAYCDTWTYNGTAWTKQNPATVPFGRYLAEACQLTTASGHVIMFGGFGGSGNGFFLNETWDWNGAAKTWTLESLATSPAARIGHCMDGGASFLVMFGGQGTNQLMNDTWKFDGATWSQLNPATSPSARTGACMAYDQTNNVWVMFGGMNTYYRLPETWTFNGTTWSQKSPVHSPPGLTWAQMCWDQQTGKVLLFGGYSATDNYASNQTWCWNGTDWSQL